MSIWKTRSSWYSVSLSFIKLQNFWPNLEALVFPSLMLRFYICRKKIRNCGFSVFFIPTIIHIYFAICFGVMAIYTYFNASYKVKIQKKLKACKRNHKMLNRKAINFGWPPKNNDVSKYLTLPFCSYKVDVSLTKKTVLCH